MSYKEALAWLFGTQRFGIKLGLENIQRLLGELGVPGKEQRIVHVAGTNGKGSVCAMIDSITRAQGYRTGLFTSPHLVTFRERIQVNGEMISESEVAAGLSMIRELIRAWEPHPTFFEIATALGLHHFAERECEIIVLETGMGGRLDATNAIAPVVSVITPIDYDHQKWLGNTLTEISSEKAGIIKRNVPVVAAPQKPAAREVIEDQAHDLPAPLTIVTDEWVSSPVALSGSHQRRNAALAVRALRVGKFEVSDEAIARGLASVTWPGRFQRWDDRIVVDGAHNPAGAEVLARTWRENFGKQRASLVLAVLRDKDVSGIWRALRPVAERVFLPCIRTERALPSRELTLLINEDSPELPVLEFPSFDAALRAAGDTHSPILITGSLHFAGEALAALKGVPAAFEECAQ